jgi:hypothetical protein
LKAVMSQERAAVTRIEEPGGAWIEALDVGGRVERNPYGMLAGALGIGFVLGGGLFTRLTARIVGAGLRIGLMAALPVVQRELIRAATISTSDINKGE